MIKIFVSGCYDIIHGGHVEFFNQAKNIISEEESKLVVSFAGDSVLMKYKGRKSSLPEEHKKRLLEALEVVDEVVMGTNVEVEGLDFIDEFRRIKPDYLVVTVDDKFEVQKRQLCEEVGATYIQLPKTLHYEKISTTDLVNWIKAPKTVPLRVDFAGGWLDVPRYAMKDSFIVNCAISPLVSLTNWPYNIKSGLGGSGAYAILSGKDAVESELNMGVGWQDPAIIRETGLCVWKSGERPVMEMKANPIMLSGKMALVWTGQEHDTPANADNRRNYNLISTASKIARVGVLNQQYDLLCDAVNLSYKAQLEEGMAELPDSNEIAKKYCGGGFGGYAVYLFDNIKHRNQFCYHHDDAMKIEPFINS